MRWTHRFRFRDHRAQELAIEALQETAYAARVRGRDLPESEAALNNANAVSEVVQSLSDIDDAVVSLGPIVIIKRTIAGRSGVRVHRFSAAELLAVGRFPEVLDDAESFFPRLRLATETLEVAQQELAHGSGEELTDP